MKFKVGDHIYRKSLPETINWSLTITGYSKTKYSFIKRNRDGTQKHGVASVNRVDTLCELVTPTLKVLHGSK